MRKLWLIFAGSVSGRMLMCTVQEKCTVLAGERLGSPDPGSVGHPLDLLVDCSRHQLLHTIGDDPRRL
jgi:hypothetical protein